MARRGSGCRGFGPGFLGFGVFRVPSARFKVEVAGSGFWFFWMLSFLFRLGLPVSGSSLAHRNT